MCVCVCERERERERDMYRQVLKNFLFYVILKVSSVRVFLTILTSLFLLHFKVRNYVKFS